MRTRNALAAVVSLAFGLFAASANATCPAPILVNGHTANAGDVNDLFDCKAPLDSPGFSGNVEISNTSGATLTLDKPGGAALLFTRSSANSYLVEDDSGLSSNSLGFYAWTGSAWLNLVNFKNNGNVGIGTGSPTQQLTVAGSGRIFSEPTTGTIDASIEFHNSGGYAWAGLDNSTGTGYFGSPYSFDIYNAANTPIIFGTNSTEDMRILPNGNVGIGTTTPSYLLTVNGTAYATGAAGALSDRRHKKDIRPLSSDAIDLVEKLKPVTFLWKDPKDNGMKGRQMGFIAQDVQQVVPSVVITEHNEEKTLGLKYNEFLPILAKAIQEQQAEIKRLRAANDNQASLLMRQEAQIKALERRVNKRDDIGGPHA